MDAGQLHALVTFPLYAIRWIGFLYSETVWANYKYIKPALAKKSPVFYETVRSLPCLQHTASGPCPEPDPLLDFLEIHFNIILPYTPSCFRLRIVPEGIAVKRTCDLKLCSAYTSCGWVMIRLLFDNHVSSLHYNCNRVVS
jgi:hypothetical protein